MIASFAISSMTSAAVVALAAGTLGGIAVAALIALLVGRELTGVHVRSGSGKRLSLFSRYLAIPIVPLLLVFTVIVAVRVWEVL
ncbi:MAG: hypothetical protein ACE5EW_03110 [Thermoplasmata archaeon]